jgi:hypothetical protein
MRAEVVEPDGVPSMGDDEAAIVAVAVLCASLVTVGLGVALAH